MFALFGARPWRNRRVALRRLLPLCMAASLLTALLVGTASADRPAAVVRVSRADAARTGRLIEISARPVGRSSLLEVAAPSSQVLLALSADGGQAATADQLGQLSGSLTLARADGSQLRTQLPGLNGAGFAPDGSWLAVVDGRGVLWRIDAATGDAALIHEGPFLGSPIVAADGSVLLLAVSSVDAPFRATAVRVWSATGMIEPLTDDELDYAGYPLADGSVAVVAHEAGRTLVRHVSAGFGQLVAELEGGAVNAVIAADGQRLAYEVAGRGVFLLERPGSTPRSLGAGFHPCFSTDATELLARRGSGTVVLALDGSVMSATPLQAAFAGAAGCLP